MAKPKRQENGSAPVMLCIGKANAGPLHPSPKADPEGRPDILEQLDYCKKVRYDKPPFGKRVFGNN